ncbi:MAG: hypothetical protein IJV59_07075 [Eubacterium sp.]|nr:hypothetical protein [Eubacterium sp.]
MKKRILILCLAGVFILSLSACGRSTGEDVTNAGDAAKEQTAEEVQEKQDEVSVTEQTEKQDESKAEDQEEKEDQEKQDKQDTADEGEAEDMASFWGSTTIATAVSDSYASIQDAYIDGSTLVINGTYDITTDEGDVLDTSDAGEHRFTLSGSAKLGSMGGDGEPETMSVEEFDEILQYDMENNPGLGLIFYVENDRVLEVWITS